MPYRLEHLRYESRPNEYGGKCVYCIYEDGSESLVTCCVDERAMDEHAKRLNERENEIITLRFFEGKTQMEVAEYIGISQAQVSRLEKNALAVMKKYLLF